MENAERRNLSEGELLKRRLSKSMRGIPCVWGRPSQNWNHGRLPGLGLSAPLSLSLYAVVEDGFSSSHDRIDR